VHLLNGPLGVCPAWTRRCWTCRAKGHFAKVCEQFIPCCPACLEIEGHWNAEDCEARNQRCWRCNLRGHFRKACRVVDPKFRHGQAVVVEYMDRQYRGVVLARMRNTLMYRVELLPLTHDGRRTDIYWPNDGFHPIMDLGTMWPAYDEVGDRFVACLGCQEGNNVDGWMWRTGCNRQRAQDWVREGGVRCQGPGQVPAAEAPEVQDDHHRHVGMDLKTTGI
jgi:hypothetical protein